MLIMESFAELLQKHYPFNLIRASRDFVGDNDPPDIDVCVKLREPDGWVWLMTLKLVGSMLRMYLNTSRFRHEQVSRFPASPAVASWDVADPVFSPDELVRKVGSMLNESCVRSTCQSKTRKKSKRR